MATVLVDDQCLIPGDLATLAAFRRWALSDDFPTTGRIDWVASHIEVDRSPEDIFTHGTLKTALIARLWPLATDRGIHLFAGETRVSSEAGNLSVEPDVVAVSDDAIEAGRVRLVPAAGGKPDRFVELEGAPDLIVEIASDSSTRKDTQRLPASYHAAGVREFWLIDARRADVQFTINCWEPLGYVADTTSDGTSRSDSEKVPATKSGQSRRIGQAARSSWSQRRRTKSRQGRISMPSSVRRARGARQTRMQRLVGCSSRQARSPLRWSLVGRSVDFTSTATSAAPRMKSTSSP